MNKTILSLLVTLLAAHSALATAAQYCDPSFPQTSPTTRWVLKADGTALDKRTGLIWKRCAEGQTWNGTSCQGVFPFMTWQNALKLADSAVFAGKSDWRLPDPKEMTSIFEYACVSPALSPTVFPNLATTNGSAELWTSTSMAHPNEFWGKSGYLYFGTIEQEDKTSPDWAGALLVRSAP